MALTKIPGNLIQSGAITAAALDNDAVTTAKILDANITHAKLHTSMDLTGKTVTVATAAGSTNTTAAASTAFVQQELTTLIGGAPGTLDTLNELAAAINDDDDYHTTLTTALATKLPLAGGTMTGALTTTEVNIGAAATNGSKLRVHGKIVAGDSSSTGGDVLLEGYYGNGATAVIGSEYSSGGVFLGYGVHPSTTTQGQFLSSTTATLSQGAYVVSDTHKWYTVTAGSSVAVGSQLTTMTERMRITGAGNVGIGVSSTLLAKLHIGGAPIGNAGALAFLRNTSAAVDNTSFGGIHFSSSPGTDYSIGKANVNGATSLSFRNGNTGASLMELSSDGKLLLGTTSIAPGSGDVAGSVISPDGYISVSRTSVSAEFNRIGSNGDIIVFRKGGTQVGSWQARGDVVSTIILDPRTNGAGLTATSNTIYPTSNTGAIGNTTALVDLGTSGYEFRNLSLSGLVTATALKLSASSPTLTLETTANANNPLITLKSSGAITSEGAQIYYNNDQGTLHITTTYPNIAAGIKFHTATGTDRATNNDRMTITGNGDLVLGAWAEDPAGFSGWRAMNIRGLSTGGMLNFENSSGTRSFTFANQGVGMRYQGHIAGSYHRFETNGAANALYITDAGDVGIGTSDASDTAWGAIGANKALTIDGTTGFANIHLRGTGSGSVAKRFSMGVGNQKFYMAYDDIAGVHRITVENSGDVTLSNNLVMGTGAGISFGNNANYSGMSSEILDDYEEGTWTPTLGSETVAGSSATGNYNNNYVKIGRLVHVTGWFNAFPFSSITSGTYVMLRGLPFRPAHHATSFKFSYTQSNLQGGNYGYGHTSLYACYILVGGSTGNAVHLTRAAVGAPNSGTTHFMFDATYYTAD